MTNETRVMLGRRFSSFERSTEKEVQVRMLQLKKEEVGSLPMQKVS